MTETPHIIDGPPTPETRTCPACNGTGGDPIPSEGGFVLCSRCNDTGRVARPRP